MRLILLICLLATLQACNSGAPGSRIDCIPPLGTEPKQAPVWRGELQLGPRMLPFNFTLDPDSSVLEMTLLNASERLKVPHVRRQDDSMIIRMPFFDSEFRTVLRGDSLTGVWHNRARSSMNLFPFQAGKNDSTRFKDRSAPATMDVSGRWKVTFVHAEKDSSWALGQFEQRGDRLTGTFLTPTGDYRYLQGRVSGRQMFLSCFDGAHAFLFEAAMDAGGMLEGGFWSGAHWYERWTAVRDDTFAIPHPDSLTWLRKGYESLSFAFPNADSQIVSLADPAYRGKVVVVEIMGTWCPNCMDETLLLREMYREMQPEGLELVSLAFEVRDDFGYAAANVRRMTDAFALEHEVLIAGKAGPRTAGAALPMLNHVMSYPTTIFIDRKGRVRRIHTGFTGPATGEHYTNLVADFRKFVRELLNETPV